MPTKTKRSFLEILVPAADYQDRERPASRHPPRPRSIKGKTVVLVPNLKVISPPFMETLAQRLKRETGVKRAFTFNSSDWAFNHPQRMEKIASEVDGLARECELMVSGIGD